jgi:hypothetical protein
VKVNYSRLLWLLIALVLLVYSVRGFSRGIVTGSISGTVQDPSSAVIVGASITATQEGTNATFKTKSSSAGSFQIPGMPIGVNTVNIQAPGFIAIHVRAVNVTSGAQTPLGTRTLKIGNSEAVTVEGATALLQPDSVQVNQTFDTQKIANLPIGNGFDIVALFTPGISPSGGNIFTNNNGGEFSTNGLRDRNNNFELDGQANNDTNIGGPNVFFGNQDALAEVQIITNDSAEYGKNSGERRMKFVKPTRLHRKSGIWGTQSPLKFHLPDCDFFVRLSTATARAAPSRETAATNRRARFA